MPFIGSEVLLWSVDCSRLSERPYTSSCTTLSPRNSLRAREWSNHYTSTKKFSVRAVNGLAVLEFSDCF